MTLGILLRVLHVLAGFASLVMGPFIMRASKRSGFHTRAGDVYFALVTLVCLSAIALALLEWTRLRFFFWIGVGTYAFALPGYLAAKQRWRHWLLIHAVGVTSSYVAIATAFLVNNLATITGLHLPFATRALVPMFIGTCAVAWLAHQVHTGRRPKLLRRRGSRSGQPSTALGVQNR